MTKTCTCCEVPKPLDAFHRTKATRDGYHTRCKTCRHAADAALYKRTRKRKLARAKAYYADNREQILDAARERYATDPAFREAAIKRSLAQYEKRYAKRRENPRCVLAGRLRVRLRKVLNDRGVVKHDRTFDLLGYSPAQLRVHLAQQLDKPCVCCGDSMTLATCHIDHTMPLVTAATLREVLDLNRLDNLRVICAGCNLRKQAKITEAA